jgi:hypothetical protein
MLLDLVGKKRQWNGTASQFRSSFVGTEENLAMQTAIERVMQTYGMMVSLTSVQEREARKKVSKFLENKGDDEHKLAVEGLKYLLGHASKPRRRAASLQDGVE